VLLYIRDFMTRDQLLEAKNKVDQYKGIINTMLGQVSANILLVDYDPGVVSGKEIVDQLERHGISAKLVAI
ncbi:MAG: hypothetical protein PVH04_12785, partial [Gammaproteobacteria bacterium]